MRCPHCGFEDPEDLAFCSECGRPQASGSLPNVAQPPPPTKGGMARPAPRPAPAPPPRFGAPPGGGTSKSPLGRLIGLDGPLEGMEFVLDRPEVGIGRRPDCDIRVPEHGVSRLHARVRTTRDGYVIEDAGSANGTWVNDACVEGSLLLTEGDVVRIGPCSFVFHDERSATPLPPGSMTVVADVGQDPSPFGGGPLPMENAPVDRSPTPAFLPASAPWPEAPARPAPRPGPGAAPVPRPDLQPVQALREQLTELNRDLGSYIQRLDTLAESLTALEGQLSDARPAAQSGPLPPVLQKLSDELAAAGGVDQYQALQALLNELRASPTDLRLLLRLSDQLPMMSTLVQSYLRALTALQNLDRG